MNHIEFASQLGILAARSKFAAENPMMAEKKDKASKGGFLQKHKALLMALLGGGALAGGGVGLHHLLNQGGSGGYVHPEDEMSTDAPPNAQPEDHMTTNFPPNAQPEDVAPGPYAPGMRAPAPPM